MQIIEKSVVRCTVLFIFIFLKLFFFFCIFFPYFLATTCGMCELNSLTGGQTHTPCSGSVES